MCYEFPLPPRSPLHLSLCYPYRQRASEGLHSAFVCLFMRSGVMLCFSPFSNDLAFQRILFCILIWISVLLGTTTLRCDSRTLSLFATWLEKELFLQGKKYHSISHSTLLLLYQFCQF